MSEHTKKPWEIRKEVDGLHADWLTWVCSGKRGIAVCNNQIRRSTFNAGRDEAEANARHIVHCVNNHERLVEMLERVMASNQDFIECEKREDLGRPDIEWSEEIQQEARALLAALEAEKGGE